jgi:hypothetical protein
VSLRRRFLLLLGCIFAAFTVAAAVAAAEPPWPIDAYRQALEETHALVTQPHTTTTDTAQLADEWAAINAVLLPDGTVVPVDHSHLVALLRAEPLSRSRLEAFLTTLLDAEQATVPASVSPQYGETLTTILSAPEFQWKEQQPSALEEWWRRLQERFWAWISELFGWDNADGYVTVPVPSWLVTIAGSLILFLVLFYVLRGLEASFVAERSLNPDEAEDDAALTATTAMKRAQTLSASGDYRTAVRYLYLSALLAMDERGLLRYDRSLTNREYIRTLEKRPLLARTFGSIVGVFDRVWYGEQPVDADTYADYVAHIEDLERAS